MNLLVGTFFNLLSLIILGNILCVFFFLCFFYLRFFFHFFYSRWRLNIYLHIFNNLPAIFEQSNLCVSLQNLIMCTVIALRSSKLAYKAISWINILWILINLTLLEFFIIVSQIFCFWMIWSFSFDGTHLGNLKWFIWSCLNYLNPVGM